MLVAVHFLIFKNIKASINNQCVRFSICSFYRLNNSFTSMKFLRCNYQTSISVSKSFDAEDKQYPFFMKRCGKVRKSMLHQAFCELKDKELLLDSDISTEKDENSARHNQDSSLKTSNLIDLESTFYPRSKIPSKHKQRAQFFHSLNNGQGETTLSQCSSSLTTKDLFYQKMQLKYQDPATDEFAYLAQRYPEPALLFSSVMLPLVEATGQTLPVPMAKSHLRGLYWKASLAVPWSNTIVASHPDKHKAIHAAYLAACQQLEELGLTCVEGEGHWQPMTCEKVVTMLDTLAKYVESSFVSSKGRGFKIILNQAQNSQVIPCLGENLCDEDQQEPPELSTSSMTVTSGENENCHLAKPVPRSIWVCTVHVGWPFPFTVKAQAVSLPGAQMLGYMKVASKLKSFGLLRNCSSVVSRQVLGRLLRLDVEAHWEKSLMNHTVLQKFNAEAELFCDASYYGFGAYLVLNDSTKVRWLCETWEDHCPLLLSLLCPSRRAFDSTFAELYATVASVCSWKKKLRSTRVICYSDNLTTVALINSYVEKQIPPERCVTHLDRLISTLQTVCTSYGITIQAAWLCRNKNSQADLLSRCDSHSFLTLNPQAACHRTRTKKISIPWHRYSNKNTS